jgi:hypothetical protein
VPKVFKSSLRLALRYKQRIIKNARSRVLSVVFEIANMTDFEPETEKSWDISGLSEDHLMTN